MNGKENLEPRRGISPWLGIPLVVLVVAPPAAAHPEAGAAGRATGAYEAPVSPEKRAAARPEKKPRLPKIQMLSSSRNISPGDMLTIRVRLDNGSDVGSVPFHVTYNPQVLRFESGEEGSFLHRDGAQTAFFASPMSAPGEIAVGLSRLGAAEGAKGSGDLCLLRFRVISRGDAGLAFTRASVKDPRNKILPSSFQPARVRTR